MGGAIDAFRRATALAPGDGHGWSNLGKALAAEGRFDEAWPAFANAARLAPRDGQLRLNHAVALLKAGLWAEGWPLFRARHGMPGRAPAPPGPELGTLEGVAGRTILLVHEEGFGDTLQFIRYAPLLMERGATVLAWVPAPLVRLLGCVPGLQTTASRPARYDAWCRIPDLPFHFRTDARHRARGAALSSGPTRRLSLPGLRGCRRGGASGWSGPGLLARMTWARWRPTGSGAFP